MLIGWIYLPEINKIVKTKALGNKSSISQSQDLHVAKTSPCVAKTAKVLYKKKVTQILYNKTIKIAYSEM